ncbi:hypothetical protein H7F51_16330 [Novosphingobium flavum]|uniref:AbiV family abortive infection protein n=1 Tax=Novosphingobium flavum TaxID=1778672 RepID=A0A7X1FVE4_9SPHN|nr:hypothetical protein [Novosphingobium flavum]MBC2667087.1 hypothetical protein [Novosphingobium flavum]
MTKILVSIEEAKKLSDLLWDGMDGLPINGGLRERLAIAALVVSLHHHRALIFLLENGSYQSFMALLRPQTDAWVNGAWLHLCATDGELENFAAGKSHVQPREIFERLEAAMGNQVIANLKKGRWKEMCDFTHTGIFQLNRNLTADTVEPNYPEDELIGALEQANVSGVIAGTFAAGVANNQNLANSLLAKALEMTAPPTPSTPAALPPP